MIARVGDYLGIGAQRRRNPFIFCPREDGNIIHLQKLIHLLYISRTKEKLLKRRAASLLNNMEIKIIYASKLLASEL
jgi:hypothetical protein